LPSNFHQPINPSVDEGDVGGGRGVLIGELTLRSNVVVLVTPPPVAVTVIVELPAGVEVSVFTFKVEEHAGLQLTDENEAVAPVGNPEAAKTTGSVLPDTKVVPIVLVAEDPAMTDWSPELTSEKLNIGVIVKDALLSVLGLWSALKAFAFTVALLVSMKGAP
jgi:hypothetical protein